MKKPISFLFSAILLSLVSLAAYPQSENRPAGEPNYEAVLQLVAGTDRPGGRAALPPSLSGVAKQLRSNFSFESYSLVNTHIARVAHKGTLEYKSVSSIQGREAQRDSPDFMDWHVANLRSIKGDTGREVVQIQMFRFGARIPVRLGGTQAVNYENVGLVLGNISIVPNSPTLLGTLSLPETAGTLFLVLTLRPVDQ